MARRKSSSKSGGLFHKMMPWKKSGSYEDSDTTGSNESIQPESKRNSYVDSFRRRSMSSNDTFEPTLSMRSFRSHSLLSAPSNLSMMSEDSNTSLDIDDLNMDNTAVKTDTESEVYSDNEHEESSDNENEIGKETEKQLLEANCKRKPSKFDRTKFQKEFESLVGKDEVLLTACTCALSKEILYQGRMFVTPKYVCFYSRLFNIVQRLVIPFTSITKLEPRMTINFIPNAIAIYKNTGERFIFASFSNRNKFLELLRQLRNSPINTVAFPNLYTHSNSSPNLTNGLYRSHSTSKIATTDAKLAQLNVANSHNSSSNQQNQQNHNGALTPANSSANSANTGILNQSVLAGLGSVVQVSGKLGQASSPRNSQILPNHSATFPTHQVSNATQLNSKAPQSRSSSIDKSAIRPKRTSSEVKRNSLPVMSSQSRQRAMSTPNPMKDDEKMQKHSPTAFPDSKNEEKVLATETVHAALPVVANLLFGADTTWVKHLLIDIEKNRDVNNVPSFPSFTTDATRYYEYTKPLNAPVGPKQTKCKCTDKIIRWDYNSYVEVISTTATPDVPSGGSFTTLTRTVLAWGPNNSTKLRLGTWLEWTGKSWLKGPIEKGAIDGQNAYCKSLITELGKKLKSSTENSPQVVIEKDSDDNDSSVPPPMPVRQKRRSAAAQKAVESLGEWQKLCAGLAISMVVLLVVVLWLLLTRPTQTVKIDKSYSHELKRIEEELKLWQWIDDRKGVTKAVQSSDLDLAEAIAQSEQRLALLKAQLIQ